MQMSLLMEKLDCGRVSNHFHSRIHTTSVGVCERSSASSNDRRCHGCFELFSREKFFYIVESTIFKTKTLLCVNTAMVFHCEHSEKTFPLVQSLDYVPFRWSSKGLHCLDGF